MSGALSDDEVECRICRSPAELPQRPLLHPCRCSGSIRYTHEDCLVNWLAQSKSLRCELCHHPFRFEPVYREDTPRALPADELVLGLVHRGRMAVLTTARVALVVTVWLFLLPLGTCWTWYALFINALSQLPSLIASRGFTGVVTDAFYGCLLSAGILFIFLGVSSLREYIRHVPDEAFDVHGHEHHIHGAVDGDAPDDLHRHHHNHDHHNPHRHHRRRRRHLRAENQEDGVVVDGHGDGIGDGEVTTEQAALVRIAGAGTEIGQLADSDVAGPERPAGSATTKRGGGIQVAGDGNTHHDPDQLGVLELEEKSMHPADDLVPQDQQSLTEDEAESDLFISDMDDEVVAEVDALARDVFGNEGNETAEDNAVEAEHHGANLDDELGNDDSTSVASSAMLEGHYANELYDENQEDDMADVPVDDVDDGVLDDDHNDDERGFMDNLFPIDPDDAPIDEMIGLRGPLRNLFDNAGTVLVSNAIFLGIFTLIPLLVGRLALRVASLQSLPHLISVASRRNSTATSSMLGGSFESVPRVVSAVTTNVTENISRPTMAAGNASNSLMTLSNVVVPFEVGKTPFVDVVALEPIVSYIDNLFVVLLGYGVISLAAFGYVIVNSLLRSRYPRLDTPMTRQVVRALRYTATFVKIVVLILFEFGIFPLGCGWWFDVCTLNIVGSTLSSRSSFCREFPWTCTAGHWFIGIFYMVHVSLFVSLLREVLQPQLLWFLRNPDDPEFHPFRELVEKPLSRHARRMCLSMLIYIPLIFAVVFVPGQICLAVLPNVFPFNLADFSHSLVEVPFGNLLIVPLISLVHHARPGSILRIFLRLWIQQVGGFLGIAHLVARDEFDEDDPQLDEAELDQMSDFNDDDGGSEEGDEDLDVFAPFEPDRLEADEVEADGLAGGANIIAHRAREVNQVDVSSVSGEPEDIASGNIQTFDGESHDAAPPHVSNVRGRAITMLFLAWLTLVVGECIALTLPTVLGRAIIRVVGLPSSHDLHSFGLGFYVHLAVLELAYRAHDFMASVDAATLLRMALPYISIVMKGLLQWLLWFGLAPLASGLLVELTVTVPLRVSYMESPYFYLYQDWALGLLLIKVWSKIADAGGFGARWRERMERARDGGLLGAGRNFSRTFCEVVGPILFCSVLSLAIPYTFVHSLLPCLGFSLEVSSFIYRYLYVWLMCFYMTFVIGRYTRAGLCALHDSIRDDKYLVGRRLYNYS